MQVRKYFVFTAMLAVFILGACAPIASESEMMEEPAGAAAVQPTDAMMETPAEAMMEKTAEPMMETPAEAMMENTAEPMMEGTAAPGTMAQATPAGTGMMDQPTEGAMMDAHSWFSAGLTNVASGEAFSIEDYKGKVVLVELMAQWCSTCLRQQKQVAELHEQLGMGADLVSIALDIDPNEDAETLKAYAASNGFDWVYAVAPPDVAREIGNLYGAQYLNPPSAPMLLINRKGEVVPLPFGVKSADELEALIRPLLEEGM